MTIFEQQGEILGITKKKVFYALFCVLLITNNAWSSPIDHEVGQILQKILKRMAPEEIAKLEQEGLSGWRRVTFTALTQALKHDVPSQRVYGAVFAQLESPDKLLKFMETHPNIVSDLKPGLTNSIKKLMSEGQGGGVQASVLRNTFGHNRLQALVAPTQEELAVLRRAAKAPGSEVGAMASA